MMKLVILINSQIEYQRALVDVESMKCILQGDYYHDKINEQIEGYLQALEDNDIYSEEVDSIWIDITDPYWDVAGFYI